MRHPIALIPLVLAAACGGPSQNQLAETPTAQTRPVPSMAPPASTSDKDRERLIQQFDDMQATQRAYEEANRPAPPPAPVQGTNPPAAPKKKGPAEQATLPKKKGPAEQAPSPAKDE